jgi:hypothetical protein
MMEFKFKLRTRASTPPLRDASLLARRLPGWAAAHPAGSWEPERAGAASGKRQGGHRLMGGGEMEYDGREAGIGASAGMEGDTGTGRSGQTGGGWETGGLDVV